MGFIVLVMCSPILIPLIIVALILGLKGDEWFGHPDPKRKGQYVYIHNEEGEIVDIFKDKNGTFHGGICLDEDDDDDYDLFDNDDDDDFYDDIDEDDRLEGRKAFERFQSGNYDATDIALMAEDDDIFDEFEDEL